MDPISITASVVGVTAACLKIARILHALRPKYLEASATIAAICSESTLVSASLAQVQMLLLRDSAAVASQLQSRPELAATFDTTLTGCTVVFACLEEEAKRLDIAAGGAADQDTWKHKAKIAWKAGPMKELLQSIRGQQGAITLLIQMLQMESLSDIHRLLQNNTMLLKNVARRTLSLRSSLRYSNSRISRCVSVLRQPDIESVSAGDTGSTVGTTEFEFDDTVINSKAYRRALEGLQRQTVSIRQSSAMETDLMDPPETNATAPSPQSSSNYGNAMADLQDPNLQNSRTTSTEISEQRLTQQAIGNKSFCARRKTSGSEIASEEEITSLPDEDFWLTTPNLELDETLLGISLSDLPALEEEALTISSRASSFQCVDGSSLDNFIVCTEVRPSYETSGTTNPFEDHACIKQSQWVIPSSVGIKQASKRNNRRSRANDERVTLHRTAKWTPGLLPNVVAKPLALTITVQDKRPHQTKEGGRLSVSAAYMKDAPVRTPSLNGLNRKPPPPAEKMPEKPKTVSFQLPIDARQDSERASIDKRLREERGALEQRRRTWDQRRRKAAGDHKNPRLDDSAATASVGQPPWKPFHGRGGSALKVPQLRGSHLPPPELATAAIVRAAHSVYALNSRAPSGTHHNSYQRAWKPAAQT